MGREWERETPVRTYAVVWKQDCRSWSRTVDMERKTDRSSTNGQERKGHIYEALRVLSTVQGLTRRGPGGKPIIPTLQRGTGSG